MDMKVFYSIVKPYIRHCKIRKHIFSSFKKTSYYINLDNDVYRITFDELSYTHPMIIRRNGKKIFKGLAVEDRVNLALTRITGKKYIKNYASELRKDLLSEVKRRKSLKDNPQITYELKFQDGSTIKVTENDLKGWFKDHSYPPELCNSSKDFYDIIVVEKL